MATNIEQIFRSFVVNKFKEIQEEGKLNSDNSENPQNGELTAQKEESTSETTAVSIQSERAPPACQDETMKTENLELAKPVTKVVETDSASKELKSAELTSDDDGKRESSKKKSKKHKKHKSKKKKKKKKKEKHEKRSKSSVSSVEDQENVCSETKSVWKPAFSSPPKEQEVSDAFSKAENTNTDVLSSVNTQSISPPMEDKPAGLLLDVDSGFFGPKCPFELSKNASSNSPVCDEQSQEHCEASAPPTQLSNESSAPIENASEIAETPQSGQSLPIYLQEKDLELSSSLDDHSEKDSLNPSDRCEVKSKSKSICENLQMSNKKSRSNSRHRSRSGSVKNLPKSLETSTKSPKSRQRSNSISRDQRKQSRSSSAGQRRRSSSRSPVRRRRSRSRADRYSRTPIRDWWSKSIRNRRRSVSVVKRHGSRTRSPARRKKSRSRSTEKRQLSRSRSPSGQRKSTSASRKYRRRSKSAGDKRTRSKSTKGRHSKSVSVSKIRRSRSYSGSQRRKSRSGSVSRRLRSWSKLAGRKLRSRSGSAARKRRSRSVSAIRRRKSRSATPARRRSRSISPVRRRRSRSASFARRRRRSRSTSLSKRRKSKSGSPSRRRRTRSPSPARRRRSRSSSPRRRRSRSVSPVRRRRSRSVSPVRRRRSRSVSPVRRRRSRSVSPVRRRRSRSVSPVRRRRSRSVSPVRRRRSRSASRARRRWSRSASPRRRRSRSASPPKRRRSKSISPANRRRSSSVSRRRRSAERKQRSNSAVKRRRSRSGSDTKRQSARSTSAARKPSKSTSPSTTKTSSQSNTGNMSPSHSGSNILKDQCRSVERKHKSRSRSSSKVRNPEHTSLNERLVSAPSTIKQAKTSPLSETTNDENKLSDMTSESPNKKSYLEKADTLENLKESSIVNEEIDSCVLPSVTNQSVLDSSFKAPDSNLPCLHVESNSLQNCSDSSEKVIITSPNILVDPYEHVDQTSLECKKANYENLQKSSEDAEILNDDDFQSSQKVSTMLTEDPCNINCKPDVVPVKVRMDNPCESEKISATHKDSSDMLGSTTLNQYSIDNKSEVSNQDLRSDTIPEKEGNLSYQNSVSKQHSCMMVQIPSPVQTDSNDGFKKLDCVVSPSTSSVSCIEAPPEHSSAQILQDASHSDQPKTELKLALPSLHKASITSHVASDVEVKTNLCFATNNTPLESTLHNKIRTSKEQVSESCSQVDSDSNCYLQHVSGSTPTFGLPNIETVVLLNSIEPSQATLLSEQSYSIMSAQTCSEQITKDIACGNTAESFALEHDFSSHNLINQNVTSTHTADSTEHPSETAINEISKTYPEVESTQAEMCISQSCEEIGRTSSKHRTKSYDLFSSSQDQTNIKSIPSEPHVCMSLTDNTTSSRPELESAAHGVLFQSLYSSSENTEGIPAKSSTAKKEVFGKSPKYTENKESIKMENPNLQDSEMHFKDVLSRLGSNSASGDAETSKTVLGPQDCVPDKGKQKSRLEAEPKSSSTLPGSQMFPDTFMVLSPREKLCETTVEQTDPEVSLIVNNSEQNFDNTVKSTTTSTHNDGKDLGPTMHLSIDSYDGSQSLSEKQLQLEIEVTNLSHEKTGSPLAALDSDALSVKQNTGSKIDVKPVTEQKSSSKSLSKLYKIVNADIDVETKTKDHGQIEHAPYTKSVYVCSNIPEIQNIATSVVHEKKPPTAMPVQFKFSKTFKTLASSQLCNTSDESSDKEMSKVSLLSLSAKASISSTSSSSSSHIESAKISAKSPKKVLEQTVDTPLLPEALQKESLLNVESDGKDVLKQDAIQTDDSQSIAALRHTFPHISNASSKLGVKQRQYRSRSVAQDSRSPSIDRRQVSRSRSKSTARKRSRSKSKKRSQSSSRKKSSHSKSSKNKRSRSKSRGRKRRSQSKSKSKKKHSPSKSSGKRKRSRSKSSEKVRSVGKQERSRSKSKTRRKDLQAKSPNRNRRSRSKSTVRKSSGSKIDVRKASRSKSVSRSRSRSLSVSRRHLLHSKVSMHRKPSRSSSKSTSPRKRSLSRNKGHSPSRSPARRHRSRSRSGTRRHQSRSRGRWRRSQSSSRKHSRSSSRTSGTLSTKKRRSVSKSPLHGHRSKSQSKLKDKSPVTKRKSISPIPQKKTIQSKAAAFKHSIGLKSLIQKQLSQAKSQGPGGKMSKEQIPLSTIAARAQLPAADFSTRVQVSTPSITTVSQMSVPNLAEVPLPSENGSGQIPLTNVPPEQQMATLAPEGSLPVPDLSTSTPWHVPEMASGAQWHVPDITAGTQWSMSELTTGAQWPMADLAAGSHWPMHDLGVATQWSVPDLAAGTPWAVPDVATGAQWTVPDLTASTQWTVPDLTAGSQWAMANLAPGTQWSVPDLAAAAQWTVPDLTSGTHIHSADLAPEAQVPGSDLVSEAQVPGSDLVTEAQVPGSDLTAEAQVPRSDLVSEAQVPAPDHIPDSCDNLVSEGHNLMPDVTAEALVPVASGTLVPDVAAGIPLPDVTAATQIPVPDVAAIASLPVPDVATNAHSFMSDYASYSTVHESVLENTSKPSTYLNMSLSAGEHVSTTKLESEAPNSTEHLKAPESLTSADQGLLSVKPLTRATVSELSTSLSQEQISLSSECQLANEPFSISSQQSFDPCLRSETSLLNQSTPDQVGTGMSIEFESHTNSDSQLLPASTTDSSSVTNLHTDSNSNLLQESCPSPIQSYISPNNATLVDPYQSPDNNLLIEPYSSPDRPNLVTEFSDSACQLLTESEAVSDCFALAASCASSEDSLVVKADSSHDHSHQELTKQHDGLDILQQREPSTTLSCPEPSDYFAEPHYTEQVSTNVIPSYQISEDQSDEPDIPQLVEPYGSPEHPQLVEPYASPEQPQLVEPYASPECPQIVEPYASPEHPLLVEPYGSPDSQELHESYAGQEFSQSFASPESPQAVQSNTSLQLDQLDDGPERLQQDQPFSDIEQTQLVKPNCSPKTLNSPESLQIIQSHAKLQSLNLPDVHLKHEPDETSANKPIHLKDFVNSEPEPVVQTSNTPECQQVIQSSSSLDSPQRVQPYDSPDHPQLVQPYDSPECPQLVQPYESPEHSQLVQSHDNSEHLELDQPRDSPDHPQLGLAHDSMKGSQLPHVVPEYLHLDQPWASSKHSEIEKPHATPECLEFDKPNASSEHFQTQQSHASPNNLQIAEPYIISEKPQLVQKGDGEGAPQLVQLYDIPDHLHLVQPYVLADHPQKAETYASPEHPQLVEPYSNLYVNQCDELSSGPDLPLNLESPCHDDIGENHKLIQSPLPGSTLDKSLPEQYDAKTTEPLLEGPCSSVEQKHSQPILEVCFDNSSKGSSEELQNATPKSPLLNVTESPVHLFSKQDYIESGQNLSGDSYSTQLDRSASTGHQLNPDLSNNFHQLPLEKSLLSNKQLQLEFPNVKDAQHLEKMLYPVEDCGSSDQPQILSEQTNSEQSPPSVSCLNKDNLTDQVLSDDLMKSSSHSLDLENNSSTSQLIEDKCLDSTHVACPQISPVRPLDSLEQSGTHLLDGATSNEDVSLADTLYGDSAVPSVVEESVKLKEDKNLLTSEQHLPDENTEIFKCVLPDRLNTPSEVFSTKAYSISDNLSQNEPLENYSYPFSGNNHSASIRAKEGTSWDCSEQTSLDADCLKNGKIVSSLETDNASKLDGSTVESPLSCPEQICDKPLAFVLSEETKGLSSNVSLQTQEKVENFMPVQVSTFSEFGTHVGEVSGDSGQVDNECKITPPDLLPFDSEQPTNMCLNSESSSEPVLFISQPPPELLPYDSEQPANPFLNISDYSSEQDSSVFHTPPELLPYDSDQTTMLDSKTESCEQKLSLCEPENSSDTFSSSIIQPLVSPSSVGTQTTEVTSVKEIDTYIISTRDLPSVQSETSTSRACINVEDLNNSEMLVEHPAALSSDVEIAKKLPSSQSLCEETKSMHEHELLSKITTSHPLCQREHSVDSHVIKDDSAKSPPPVSTATIEELNTCNTSVLPSSSDKCELPNFSEQEKLIVPQSHVASEASVKRSRSKSLSKTELSLSTSAKHDSPLQGEGRAARSQSKDRKKSRSKSVSRKKRSRSKSVTHTKKSRSKSVVKTRKSRSKSATRRKKSRSISNTRLRRSRSRSLSRKRHSRSISVSHKRSSRSPSAARRRRSRSLRRKRSRSKSVDYKRSHSHSAARRRRSRSLSMARRRHSRSLSPVRRKRSRSSSLHRRKRSRSSSVVRRRRSRSSSVTRRRRSRSSSVSRRRRSPLQIITRRRRSPSLVRRRRSRSQSLPHRRRSRSASHRRRSRSPSVSRQRRSPSAPRRRHSPSLPRRKRSSSAARKRRSRSTSVARKRRSRSSSASRKRRSRSSSISQKRHSQTPLLACKRRSESKSPSPKSPKNKPDDPSKSERSRSCSQSNVIRKRKTRSRSSSRDKSKSNEKRRKRSTSKDHYITKQRRKSRTPPRRKKSRSPARRASPCRSPVRRRRSRSPVRRKSFSRSPVRRKRSRSRDLTVDSVRSPKRLTDLDKAQLLEIAKANAAAMCVKAGMPLPASLKPVLTPSAPVDEKVTHRTYGVTIQELTEKCKLIAQSKEDDEVVNKPHDSDEEEDDKPFYNHPFKVSEHKPISFSLLNPSLKPAPKTQVTLTKEFPVSSGSQHRKKESDKVYGEWVPVDKKSEESKDDVFTNTGPTQPVDITAAMNERAMAQTRLTGNPFDLEALLMLNRSQEQIDAWAQSSSLPGQFTGSTGAQVLTADEISNSGPQAWLKKDQFLKAAPVTGGRGALLMRKMGWREGEGLGRHNEGNVNPILVDFKTDRKGLVADGEKASNKLTMPVIKDLSGKHPISVLMELCNKKKWSPPDFTLVDDTGPDHRKRFLFKVTVNGVTCQPNQPSVTKKLAKATAAAAALQALGALPKESITSTTNFCSASTSTP